MKETGPNLIKKILSWTIFLLTGKILKFDEVHVDNSTKIYLDKINMLLDTYAS